MSRAMEKMSSSMQPSQSSEQPTKIEELLLAVVESQRALSTRMTGLEQEMITRMNALKSSLQTSQPSQLDSLVNDLNEIKTTLNGYSEMLSAIGETVSDKRILKLSDGSTVTQSDLQALSMTKQISEQMTETTTALGELKKTVGNGRTVRVDTSKISEYAVGVLDERLAKAIEEPVQRIERIFDGYEQRVADIGAQKTAEAAQKVAEVTQKVDTVSDKATKLAVYLEGHESRLEDLAGRMQWTAVGKVAIASLPLFTSLILVGGLVWGFGSMVGIGPLFGWIWASFTAASLWWHKLLIALGGLGAVALFVWIVFRMSRWVYENLR